MNEEIKYPICPINRFFEGDESICNQEKCDWDTDTRMCSEACSIKSHSPNKTIQPTT